MGVNEGIRQVYREFHQKGGIADASTYRPPLFGIRRHLSIGKRCTAYTVLYILSLRCLTADEATAQEIVVTVRSQTSERWD